MKRLHKGKYKGDYKGEDTEFYKYLKGLDTAAREDLHTKILNKDREEVNNFANISKEFVERCIQENIFDRSFNNPFVESYCLEHDKNVE